MTIPEHSSVLDRISTQLPDIDVHSMKVIERGWDWLVLDGHGYILRIARRSEVAERLGSELCLLEWLAERAVPVPRVERSGTGPVFMLYERLPGVELAELHGDLINEAGRQCGVALSKLHLLPLDVPRRCGVQKDRTLEHIERFRSEVLPRLPTGSRDAGEELLGSYPSGVVEPSLTHSDVAGDHLLLDPGDARLTGIIDWSDAQIGDPALDLAWVLNRVPVPFQEGFREAYQGQSHDLQVRANFYYRLMPWHDVCYGLDNGKADLVEAGLRRILNRLPA